MPDNKNEWKKIDRVNDDVPDPPFLLSDEYGMVYVGSTSFDYYDAEYWFPMPEYPVEKGKEDER